MRVPRSVLDGYDETVQASIKAVQNELKASLSLVDYSAPVEQIRAEVVALMDAYCGASANIGARLSSEFYNGLRQMVTGKGSVLSLQSGRNPRATERAVRAFVQQLVDGDGDEAIAAFEDLLLERVEYEAKRAIAYNTIDNTRHDPDQPRFARVPQGEKTCDFCLMLASRGPVYLTEESAGAFTKYHAHCDCKVVPFWDTVTDGASRRRSVSMSVDGYDPDFLYDVYRGKQKFVIPDAKISNYCLLDPNKARAFKEALGFIRDRDDAKLTNLIYAAAATNELHYRMSDDHGDRYYQSVMMEGYEGKKARVLIAWIDRRDGAKMQMTTAHVDK